MWNGRNMPRQNWAKVSKERASILGFYACNFPEDVGGAGLSRLDFTLLEGGLGRRSMALTHFFGRPRTYG